MVNPVERPGRLSRRAAIADAGRDFSVPPLNRLAALINDFPSRADAAKVAGVVPDQLARYVRGAASPAFETVVKMAEARGVSLDWIATGKGRMKPDGDETGELQMVPVWNVVASSGPGSYVIDESLHGHLAFSRAWLLSLHIPLNDLHVVFNAGDSNSPVISDGDAMLIQRDIERLQGDAFYVFDAEGTLLVKQIERRADGSVVLRSRNPEYEPQVIPKSAVERLRIFGMVVWVGGSV